MTRLHAVSLLDGTVRIAGITELQETDEGIVLHRLPAWARLQHNDPLLRLVETLPSGGRIEMLTDATRIELDLHLLLLQLGATPAPPAVFDLVVDGERAAAHETRTGSLLTLDPRTRQTHLTAGGPHTVVFDGLPAGEKRIELWLPQAAVVTLRELRLDGTATAPHETRRRWVHYGSSISHCVEATRPTGVWPVVAARLADVDLVNLGLAGQCHLDPFIGRMIAAQPADLVSLKLGINIVNADSMRERTFVPAVHGLLDTIREAHPETPILVVTPIICPIAEEHPGPTMMGEDGRVQVQPRSPELSTGSLTVTRIRDLESEIVTSRREAGDRNLHLLSGLKLFGPADTPDLPDGLHPNAVGYERIGRRFHDLAFAKGPFSSDAAAG